MPGKRSAYLENRKSGQVKKIIRDRIGSWNVNSEVVEENLQGVFPSEKTNFICLASVLRRGASLLGRPDLEPHSRAGVALFIWYR